MVHVKQTCGGGWYLIWVWHSNSAELSAPLSLCNSLFPLLLNQTFLHLLCQFNHIPNTLKMLNFIAKTQNRLFLLCNKKAQSREVARNNSTESTAILSIRNWWTLSLCRQSLSVEGFSCDIILSTHFSQKVYSASKPADEPVPRGLLPAGRCMPYSLSRTFRLLEVCRTTEENNAKQVCVLAVLRPRQN